MSHVTHYLILQVSLIFLLYGNNPMNAKFGLQRLLILYHGQHSQTTDIIPNWILSQNDSNWRQTIIEALWTIKAKHVLQLVSLQHSTRLESRGKNVGGSAGFWRLSRLSCRLVNEFEWTSSVFQLGLDIQDLHIRFLNPANAEINLFIHPVLKGLYCICEEMEPIEAKQLIEHVINKDCGRHQINFTDEKYLEVFLLHWLSELVIEAGEWSQVKSKRNVFCQVDVILEFLNSNKPQLAEQLKRLIVRFNFTSNNVTSIERKKNVTDDDGYEDKHNAIVVAQVSQSSQLDDQNSFNNDSGNGTDHRYLVRQATAGYALIINQIEFYRDKIKRVSMWWNSRYEEFTNIVNFRLTYRSKT